MDPWKTHSNLLCMLDISFTACVWSIAIRKLFYLHNIYFRIKMHLFFLCPHFFYFWKTQNRSRMFPRSDKKQIRFRHVVFFIYKFWMALAVIIAESGLEQLWIFSLTDRKETKLPKSAVRMKSVWMTVEKSFLSSLYSDFHRRNMVLIFVFEIRTIFVFVEWNCRTGSPPHPK